MISEKSDTKILQVKMFGNFSVLYDSVSVIDGKSKGNKVVSLLKYFLCHKNTMISQTHLLKELLISDDDFNAISILKNIVYRLRKMFDAVGIDKSCIIYRKNAYGFFPDFEVDIDVHKFEELVEEIHNADIKENTKIFNTCLKAMELYKGDFLPFSEELWVAEYSIKYKNMFTFCLRTAFRIVSESGEYIKLSSHLKNGIALFPYDDDIACMHIYALYKLNLKKDAIREYDRITEILYNDLGISPSAKLTELHMEITSGLNNTAHSMDDVRASIAEGEYKHGAYYCNLAVFSNIYSFVVRHMQRSGQSIYLMLCTISLTDGTAPAKGEELTKAAESFHKAVIKACRRGDVYTRYSSAQFLIMLPEINRENCDVVAQRIRANYYKQSKMNYTRIDCKTISAMDLESISEEYQIGESVNWE